MRIRLPVAVLVGCALILGLASAAAADPLPGGTMDPTTIPKYREPLVIPPAMPRSAVLNVDSGRPIDYYEIAMKQFEQYILPTAWSQTMGIDPTTVWSYGSMVDVRPAGQGGTLNYPAFTIEARYDRPVRVKWINGLVDARGNYLPHLLAVDQTLHWANPPGGPGDRDSPRHIPTPYTGPVPIVTHVHGAHVDRGERRLPGGLVPAGRQQHPGRLRHGGAASTVSSGRSSRIVAPGVAPGSAIFEYPNDQRATTLWYHDHALGMTRAERLCAGPAGFYLLRGGSADA